MDPRRWASAGMNHRPAATGIPTWQPGHNKKEKKKKKKREQSLKIGAQEMHEFGVWRKKVQQQA